MDNGLDYLAETSVKEVIEFYKSENPFYLGMFIHNGPEKETIALKNKLEGILKKKRIKTKTFFSPFKDGIMREIYEQRKKDENCMFILVNPQTKSSIPGQYNPPTTISSLFYNIDLNKYLALKKKD